MGIFVRNMRAFKCCKDCIKSGFRDAIACDEWKNTADLERCVSLFCPITDIETPHGDLIDRDKLLYHDYPPEFVDKLNAYREGLPKIGEVWAHDDDNNDCVVIYRTSDSNVYYYYMSGSSSFGAIEEFKKHYHNTGEFISEVVSLKEKLKQLGCKNGTN